MKWTFGGTWELTQKDRVMSFKALCHYLHSLSRFNDVVFVRIVKNSRIHRLRIKSSRFNSQSDQFEPALSYQKMKACCKYKGGRLITSQAF